MENTIASCLDSIKSILYSFALHGIYTYVAIGPQTYLIPCKEHNLQLLQHALNASCWLWSMLANNKISLYH